MAGSEGSSGFSSSAVGPAGFPSSSAVDFGASDPSVGFSSSATEPFVVGGVEGPRRRARARAKAMTKRMTSPTRRSSAAVSEDDEGAVLFWLVDGVAGLAITESEAKALVALYAVARTTAVTSTAPGVLPAVSVKVAMPVALVVVVAGAALVPVPEVRLRLTEAFTIRTFELAFSTVTVNFFFGGGKGY